MQKNDSSIADAAILDIPDGGGLPFISLTPPHCSFIDTSQVLERASPPSSEQTNDPTERLFEIFDERW